MMPVTFPLGEHLVSEADGMLVCQKCGRSASLSEADKFAEKRCGPEERPAQTTQQQASSKCDVCKAHEAQNKTPILDPMTGQINQKLLCGSCFKDYLKILRFSGPRFGRVKARAPPNGVWFNYGENNNILFTQISGMWPCPACDEFYENLYDAVTHFAEKHPELVNKTNERVTVDVDGKTVETLRTAQRYLVCPCGFLAENIKHFAHHYSHDHGKT